MNKREQIIAVLLGGFIFSFLVLVLGYLFVYEPMTAYSIQADKLSAENAQKEAKLAKIRKELPRLQTAMKRSLPPDRNAILEYDAVMNKLIQDAKIPGGSYTIKPKSGLPLNSNVELPNKKPPFERIGLEITLKKVKYEQFLNLLRRYYDLNLLQHITSLKIKRPDEKASALPLGTPYADRPDLEISLITEAIILDGAEPRKSLFSVPIAYGIVGGGAGVQTLAFSPESARGITPTQFAEVLAIAERDYKLILAKDVFHGPAPGPRPPAPPAPPEPLKDDTSAFIRLTAMSRNQDGTGMAVIEDLAAKQEYVVEIKRNTSGELTSSVIKYYFTAKGQRKSYAPESILDISEASSRTDRKFRVVSFWQDGLVVAEKASVAEPGRPTTPTTTPGRTIQRGRVEAAPKPQTTALTALTGGLSYIATTLDNNDRYYFWRSGDSLAKIVELKGSSLEEFQGKTSLLMESKTSELEAEQTSAK